MTLVSLTLFVAPALIISACYIVIVVTIWSKSSRDIHVPTAAAGVSGATAAGAGAGSSEANGCGGNATCELLIKGNNGRNRCMILQQKNHTFTHFPQQKKSKKSEVFLKKNIFLDNKKDTFTHFPEQKINS